MGTFTNNDTLTGETSGRHRPNRQRPTPGGEDRSAPPPESSQTALSRLFSRHLGSHEAQVQHLLSGEMIEEVFTPSCPVSDDRFLHGRNQEMQIIGRAVRSRGKSIVMFGERGVGKSSLAQMACREASQPYAYHCASSGDTFETIMSNLLQKLEADFALTKEEWQERNTGRRQADMKVIQLGSDNATELRRVFQSQVKWHMTPQTVAQILCDINATLVIDEYYEIEDKASKKLFSSLMRALSDNMSRSTLIFVGMEEHIVDQLVSGHLSLARAVVELQVSMLPDADIRKIASVGLEALGLQAEPATYDQIVRLSANFPHYAHELCYHAVNTYLERAHKVPQAEQTRTVTADDVRQAVRITLDTTLRTIRRTYERAVKPSPIRLKWLLYAIASAPFTRLRTSEIRKYVELSESGGDYPVSHYLTDLVNKEILTRLERGEYIYADSMMRAYVMMRFRADTPPQEVAKIDSDLKRVSDDLKQTRDEEQIIL